MSIDTPPGRPSYLHLMEPALLLLLMRLATSVLSLRRVCSVLGIRTGPSNSTASLAPDATLQMVHSRMLVLSRNYPVFGDCLPQSLAAAAMLRIRGIRSRIHFGILKQPAAGEPLYAHAWLSVNDFIITGNGTRAAFFELGSAGTHSKAVEEKEEKAHE